MVSALSFADAWGLCAAAWVALIPLDPRHHVARDFAPVLEPLPPTLSATPTVSYGTNRGDAPVVAAIDASRSDSTRRQYHYGWSAWTKWAGAKGHEALPAAPEAVAAYLAARAEQGVSASTLNAARAAISAVHRDSAATDPTAHDVVQRTLKGLRRQAAGRGRGQAKAITADDFNAILATACNPRKTGRGVECSRVAEARGRVDRAIAALLFQGGLRRSEAAALTWRDVGPASDGTGVLVRIGRSKTDPEGTAADVRYLKKGAARAVLDLLPASPDTDGPVLGGLNGASIARRFAAAARAAGVEGRITGHSGRVGLASELTRRGASATETMLAGGWKTARMVTHYSAGATAERGAVAKYL